MGTCLTCQLVARRDAGRAPLWDAILRTPTWDLVHAYDTSHEGWLVLVARRHVDTLAELSDDESAELGPLVRDVSVAVHRVTGCAKTYLAQFAEHPEHSHVHLHLVARDVDLPLDQRGPRVFDLIGASAAPAGLVTEARRNELAAELRSALADLGRVTLSDPAGG